MTPGDCPVCEGTGSVPTFFDYADARGEHCTSDDVAPCDDCEGTGRTADTDAEVAS